jgi:hypothetical protein
MRVIWRRLRRNLAREDGFTMIGVVGGIVAVTLMAGAALAATNGDLNLTKRDLSEKRAYEAALAGIADYQYHLNEDTNYWARCTNVPSPNAVNQQDSTTRRRQVPGDPDAEYALQLIPATGFSSCNESNAAASMLEAGGVNTGSFRIRSIGYADGAEQSVVATFRRANFLDYVYFTQLETSDPVTYGFTPGSAAEAGAYSQCSKFVREGRESSPIPNSGGQFCDRIVFVSNDDINGPLHTNDRLLICGQPQFGRTSADVIEVSSPPPGWAGYSGCSGNNPNFVGTFRTNAPVLTPPPTNSKLKTIAGASSTYTGQTRIVLSGTSYTVTTASGATLGPFSIPASGVIYVANGACSSSYSPFARTSTMYPSTSGCGTVYVRGTYSGQLTIAAENDIIVNDDITRSGNGMLGLIANNFVRVYHPLSPSNTTTTRGDCNGTSNGSGSQSNLRIDAAILAINHSFIVDHYNCGNSLGTLTVNGAISQKYRGAVGTTGGTGYLKNYNYDDRLRFQEPPHFLDPVQVSWRIQRQTIDAP